MKSSIQKLIEISSSPIRDSSANQEDLRRSFGEHNAAMLMSMLSKKNGFYAFESALHIFPDRATMSEYGLIEWNAPELWRAEYGHIAESCVFFAEDIFGAQFCLVNDNIYAFEPETGEVELIAPTIEDWAKDLLQDYELRTGYPLAHAWQERHGAIPPKHRLLPITPFFMGGEFDLNNLQLMEAALGMKFRASITKQIRDLPDGTNVKLRVD